MGVAYAENPVRGGGVAAKLAEVGTVFIAVQPYRYALSGGTGRLLWARIASGVAIPRYELEIPETGATEVAYSTGAVVAPAGDGPELSQVCGGYIAFPL